MNKRILKTLLVGVMGRAQWVFDTATPQNGFEITTLCDINPDALEKASSANNLPPESCFTDIDLALRENELDCMIICAPTCFHVELAMKGLDAGLAVLTEKGMAPDWESAKRLITYNAKKQGILCVAQNYRYKPYQRTLSKCIAESMIGPIYLADLVQHRVRPEPRTLNYPFASVWDMSCHHFDSLMNMLGKPTALTAHAFGPPWSPYTHPNNTSAHIEFASGARANYFHGHDSARAFYALRLQGQTGTLSSNEETIEYSERPTTQFGTRPVIDIPFAYSDASETPMLIDFYDYAVGGMEPGISGHNNLEVMAMCQMMMLSATEGRRVLREEL